MAISGRIRIFAGALMCVLLAGCGVRYATIKTDRGEDLMLLGHDPVAYFTVGKPVRGDPKLAAKHEHATYYFTTEEHRKLFVANPEKYKPQYGGFCADGAAYGVKLGSDPTEFEIFQGRLFIFGDVIGREFWKLRPEWDVEKADLMWPETGASGHQWQSLKRLVFRVRAWERFHTATPSSHFHGACISASNCNCASTATIRSLSRRDRSSRAAPSNAGDRVKRASAADATAASFNSPSASCSSDSRSLYAVAVLAGKVTASRSSA